MDERLGIGCFEDDDFCRRAGEEGFRLVIAQDAFVHHFGSRTFFGSGVDLGKVLEQNQQIYEDKWKDSPQSAPFMPESASPTRPRLSLCMIVRDNERTIRPCLESIRPYVDEMIVVDTGSTDNTPNLCRELGARVEHFPWCDDFSAARNESLKYATGEWIFWMDSDDTIPQQCGEQLRAIAEGEHSPSTLGYVMQVHCPGADPQDVTVVDHVKLFRNRPGLRFEHRIHEQILPAIRRAGGQVEFTDIYVVHSGSEHTESAHRQKLERDFRILQLDLAERPDHPFVLFNLGMTHADAGAHAEAIDCLERSIAVSTPGESHLHKAHALLVGSLTRLERFEEADAKSREAVDQFPQDTELWFRRGIVLHHRGRLTEAIEAYQHGLQQPGERYFDSIDAGLGDYKTRHNLAMVYQDLGQWTKAEAQWRWMTEHHPHYAPGWRALGELLRKTGQSEEAKRIARNLSEDPELADEGAILMAQWLEDQGDLGAAEKTLEEALEARDGLGVLRELCRFSFVRLGPQAAESRLLQLAEREPKDASVRHNLGTVYRSQSRLAEAIESFQDSLSLRPDAPDTLVELAQALYVAGRVEEARAACQKALRFAPDHPGALAALRDWLPFSGFEENDPSAD